MIDDTPNNTTELNPENLSPCAAQVQGFLTGFLCTGSQSDEQTVIEAYEQQWELAPIEAEQCQMLDQLAQTILSQLRDSDEQFEPTIPAKDDSLYAKAEAIGLWCKGFLAGLGMMKNPQTLTPNLQEALCDLDKISQIDYTELDQSTDNESHITEIIRYIGAATLALYANSLSKNSTSQISDSLQ